MDLGEHRAADDSEKDGQDEQRPTRGEIECCRLCGPLHTSLKEAVYSSPQAP